MAQYDRRRIVKDEDRPVPPPPPGKQEVKITAVYVDPLLKRLRARLIELEREHANVRDNESIKAFIDGRRLGIIDAMNIVHDITGAA